MVLGQEFVPIRPNPYIVGNPVRNPSMFFGREVEFELVQKRFASTTHGSLMVFCGERRSGKTSILMQIQQGRLGDEFVPVLIDMQAMVAQNEAEFLRWITSEIDSQRDAIATPLVEIHSTNPAADFRLYIESLNSCKLVLLFDEYELLEEKIDKGVLSKDILHLFSSLMESQPFYLVFTGSQHLDERLKDYWHILAKAQEYRRISYLDPSDAIRLIREPITGRAEFPDAAVARILRLTSGQPYYTQGICQNVVDALNKNRTLFVTEEILDSVIETLVEHPFPQMNFVWKGLHAEHKLVLSLLAEALTAEADDASVDEVIRVSKRGRYPLRLQVQTIATALDLLFKQELLSVKEGSPPKYRFRMDLWRLWIRRLHSVWRVLREERLHPGDQRRRRRRLVLWAATFLAVLAAIFWPALRRPRVAKPMASLATGGGVGAFPDTGRVATAQVPNATPSNGWLELIAKPEEGEILVDGEVSGRGKVRVEVTAGVPHEVEVRMADHVPLRRILRVEAADLRKEVFALAPLMFGVFVQSLPDSATVFVDGTSRGVSNALIDSLRAGEHRITLHKEGYISKDTLLAVHSDFEFVTIRLTPEPPATLLVRGDRPARIAVGGQWVGSGELPNSGWISLRPGRYTVALQLSNGSRDSILVDLKSGEEQEFVWRDGRFLRAQETQE